MKSYKLPNAAASVLTISTTAVTLKQAIEAASWEDFDYNTFAYTPTWVDLTIEAESVRWLDDGNTPTAANWQLAAADWIQVVQLRDIDITNLMLIRAWASDATVLVRIGNPDRY
jgi:hypothetical protein